MRSGIRGPTAAETVAALKAGLGAVDLASAAGLRSGGSMSGRPPMSPWSQASISPQVMRFEPDEEPQETLGG